MLLMEEFFFCFMRDKLHVNQFSIEKEDGLGFYSVQAMRNFPEYLSKKSLHEDAFSFNWCESTRILIDAHVKNRSKSFEVPIDLYTSDESRWLVEGYKFVSGDGLDKFDVRTRRDSEDGMIEAIDFVASLVLPQGVEEQQKIYSRSDRIVEISKGCFCGI